MQLAAIDQGLDQDENVVGTREAIMSHEATTLLTEELINYPVEDVTEAEILDHYEKSKLVRVYKFIICDRLEDAQAARAALDEGESWEDVAARLSDGSRGPNDDYTVSMQYGRVEDDSKR